VSGQHKNADTRFDSKPLLILFSSVVASIAGTSSQQPGHRLTARQGLLSNFEMQQQCVYASTWFSDVDIDSCFSSCAALEYVDVEPVIDPPKLES
jgi:hypothetical protein